ncbi:hypothetical protein [Azorhizobium caulinodans]|uniref:hypothetical protein n=1 Tax=Azorhizobium caulinodans TaxID=7 RepID=UPI002FBED136
MMGFISQISKRLRARALFRLADAARDGRRWDAAADFYAQGLLIAPDAFAAWVQCGHARKEAGDLVAAEASYRQAMRLRREDADLHVQIGHLFSLRGQSGAAAEHYRRAAELGSRDVHALQYADARTRRQASAPLTSAADGFARADELRDRGDFESAALFYEDGLAIDPRSFPHWVQLGHMRKESGDPEAAERAYVQAFKLQQDDADLLIQMGHLYKSIGERAKASDCYARAILLGSHDMHALRFLAESEARFALYREMLDRFEGVGLRVVSKRRSGSFAMQIAQMVS